MTQLTPLRAFFVTVSALLVLGFASSHSFASSVCDGLRTDEIQSDYAPGASLEQFVQAPNQYKVTGCGPTSLFPDRPACTHVNINGQLNGGFGSCATFTSLAAAVSVAHHLRITLPPSLEYNAANLARIYDLYGNALSVESQGTGSFKRILIQILNEMANSLPPNHPQRYALAQTARRIQGWFINAADLGNFQGASTQSVVRSVAQYLNGHDTQGRVPVELIMDGWVLDRPVDHYCALRDSKEICSTASSETSFSDRRNAHSALMVGRKLSHGACYVQVQNSWKGACGAHGYGRSGRECNADRDSIWVLENELFAGVSGVRIIW